MAFQDYWSQLDADGKRRYAKRAKTSVEYLHLVAGGHRKAGTKLAGRMLAAGDGDLHLGDIRPDWARLANGSSTHVSPS